MNTPSCEIKLRLRGLYLREGPIKTCKVETSQYKASLVHLDLDKCNKSIYAPISFASPRLEYFNIPYYEYPYTLAATCPRLKNVTITDSSDYWVRIFVDAAKIKFLTIGYSTLERVVPLFPNITGLRGRVFPIFTQNILPIFKKLKYVHFYVLPFTQNYPEWFPDLEELHIELNHYLEVTSLLEACFKMPRLKKVEIEKSKNEEFQRVFSLLSLSRQLEGENYSGRALFKKLQKLPEDILSEVDRYLPLYKQTRALLEEDIGRLKKCTKPFASLQGSNLLEQIAWREYEHLLLMEIEKQIKACSSTIGESYLRNKADILKAKDKIASFAACLKDRDLSHTQILSLFRMLSPDLRQNLAKELGNAHGKSQAFALRLIEKDVLCMFDVVQTMTIKLEEAEQLNNKLLHSSRKCCQ